MVSRGINKVILIGNVGQEPEVRHMTNGVMVANITLATSEYWRDKKTGENKERTEWHKIVLFGKLAEIANEYLHKGSQIYIEGSLHTKKWQDQHGNNRYSTEIIVNMNGSMKMLGNKHTNINNEIKKDHWSEDQTLNKVCNDASDFKKNNKKVENNKIENNEDTSLDDSLIDFDDIPF